MRDGSSLLHVNAGKFWKNHGKIREVCIKLVRMLTTKKCYKTTFFGTNRQSLQYFGFISAKVYFSIYTFANIKPEYWSDWWGVLKKVKIWPSSTRLTHVILHFAGFSDDEPLWSSERNEIKASTQRQEVTSRSAGSKLSDWRKPEETKSSKPLRTWVSVRRLNQ